MSTLNICILGGSGFVGRSIAPKLVAQRHNVKVLTRRRERQRDMLVFPSLTLVEGDVNELGFLREQFQESDAVINLIGILNSSGKNSFQRIHVELANKVVEAMTQTGVPRLLHMSGLHAEKDGPSKYLRSKAEAEDFVHESAGSGSFQVTSFRPSVIFGPRDSFINRFAGLLQTMPLFLPLACPRARFQPVYVEDVAQCFVQAVKDHDTFGQRYNLCGPRAYSLLELVNYITHELGLKRRIIPLSDWQSRLQALAMQLVPGKPFTLDNYNSMRIDSVCDGGFPEVFEITPTPMEAVVPTYLKKRSEPLNKLRKFAGR